jgi:hypothetical protein
MKFNISHIISLFVAACIAICVTSCDVHEFPANNAGDVAKHQVVLNLDFSTAMPLYKEITFGRSSQSNLFDMYYHVEAHRMDQSGNYDSIPTEVVNFVSEGIGYHNQTITMQLAEGMYQLHVWAHYVEEGHINRYYVFDTLHEIAVSDTRAGMGNSDNADAFRSVMTIDVQKESTQFDVPMTRPVAKYELRASDLQEFVHRTSNDSRALSDLYSGRYTVVVRYTGYVPTLYSLPKDCTIDSRTNLAYTGAMTVVSDDEAVIGFDYLFINPYGGGVSLAVDIYDADDTRIASSSPIDVPLMQGHLTVVSGNFLSAESNGLGINSEFIGPDYNIKI